MRVTLLTSFAKCSNDFFTLSLSSQDLTFEPWVVGAAIDDDDDDILFMLSNIIDAETHSYRFIESFHVCTKDEINPARYEQNCTVAIKFIVFIQY